ncbi:TetR/AcrR family transcriptional regulator [Micromonospora sp. NPDC047548]|uniref:TetR/AcrR family transcriptional regulator n=1 Tax=Micromonospora sp. NPDC047548 TaxID=3155624 RepID=UPI0033E2DF64
MPGPQRDATRTRRTLLTTAARMLARHGTGVSLDLIAREAGASKGGLLHHFPSRETLLLDLVTHQFEEFDTALARAADPTDTAPGSFARAWIRATFDDLSDQRIAHERATLVGLLGTVPEAVHRTQAEGKRWDERFARDGLDAQRVTLILRGCDGVLTASLYGQRLSPQEIADTRDLLLALTRDTGPIVETCTTTDS